MSSSNLIEQLRAEEPMGALSGCCDTVRLVNPDGPEAADLIEAQQAEIARLIGANRLRMEECHKERAEAKLWFDLTQEARAEIARLQEAIGRMKKLSTNE